MIAADSFEFTKSLLNALGITDWKYITQVTVKIEPFDVVRVQIEKLITPEEGKDFISYIKTTNLILVHDDTEKQ